MAWIMAAVFCCGRDTPESARPFPSMLRPITKISMADANYPTGGTGTDPNTKFPAISYKTINDKFASGEYFIDSFTYSPFIDYSLAGEGGDSKVGIYADDFLTDYNYGRYEADYWGAGKKD